MNAFARTPALQAWLDSYAADHQDRVNRAIHSVCIPAILFSALGLLQMMRPWAFLYGVPLGAPEAAMALMLFFYARHDLRLALAMTLLLSIMDATARLLPWQAHAAIMALAWIGQFIGHAAYEKKRPSFFTNLVQLLVGPLFFVDKVFKKG